MINDYTIYEMIKGRPEAKIKLVGWARQYDEFSEYDSERFLDDISMPSLCLNQYRSLLYDFFDSLKIICTIRTNWKGQFIPTVNIPYTGLGKGKVYSSKGRQTRIEAESIIFNKAFEYLETI